MDFVIFGDYIAHLQCMGFQCLVDCFLGQLKYWFCFMLLIVSVVFGSGMDGLRIS